MMIPSETPLRILALDLQDPPVSEIPYGTVERAAFRDLDAKMLARVRPDQVVFPLLSRDHDAIAMIERLQSMAISAGSLSSPQACPRRALRKPNSTPSAPVGV
jgi:hypothetical protein